MVSLVTACSGGGATGPEPDPAIPEELTLETVAEGLEAPVFLTAAPGGTALYVVERRGTVRILEDGALQPGLFLDIRDRARSGGEQGLLSLGDGGGGGDPEANGQDPTTLLGTLLRLDVDAGDPYAVPPDYPFVGSPEGRDEVWAYGLRNPWRFAFDRGHSFVADVGQNAWEEVNAVDGALPGLNYGWNVMEGTHCFGSDSCDTDGLTLPVVEYGRSEGCSVTGGYVSRGSQIPGLAGHYFYGDFCSGRVWSFALEGGEAMEHREWSFPGLERLSSFGVDAAGDLYLISLTGTVFRVVAAE